MTKKSKKPTKPTIKSKRPPGPKLTGPHKPKAHKGPSPKKASASARPGGSSSGKGKAQRPKGGKAAGRQQPRAAAARPSRHHQAAQRHGAGTSDQGIGRDDDLGQLGPLLPVEPRAEDPRIKDLAVRAWNAALDKKCVEPVLLDVRALASYADYILVCSGRSDRQVAAIAEGVRETLSLAGKRPLSAEGLREGQWSLIDFGDVIVHVFYHPVREFYDLEGLWSDAPRVPLEVPPEARAQYADSYAT